MVTGGEVGAEDGCVGRWYERLSILWCCVLRTSCIYLPVSWRSRSCFWWLLSRCRLPSPRCLQQRTRVVHRLWNMDRTASTLCIMWHGSYPFHRCAVSRFAGCGASPGIHRLTDSTREHNPRGPQLHTFRNLQASSRVLDTFSFVNSCTTCPTYAPVAMPEG